MPSRGDVDERGADVSTRRGGRNRRAAWTLLVLTPVVAELALGSTPIRMAWLVLLWVPIYGAGVLLVRELVVRSGRGWPSILLLGLAYELVEDGIGLQALTSPHLYDAADWGLRVWGFNAPYWEANVVYHAVFTLAVPIAVTDLVFPQHRGRPYLGRGGLVLTGLVALLGVGVLRASVPPSEDPGYQAPLPFVLGCIGVVVVLGVLALRVLPPMRGRRDGGAVPSRARLFAGGAITTLAFFGLTFPVLDATQPAWTHGHVVVVPMLAAAALTGTAYVVLRRMAASADWTERHTLALVAGALVGHTLGGLVTVAHTSVDRIGLVVIVLATVVATQRLDRQLAARSRR